MKYANVFYIYTLVCLLCGCNKDNPPSPTPVPVFPAGAKAYLTKIGTGAFTYDANGNLISNALYGGTFTYADKMVSGLYVTIYSTSAPESYTYAIAYDNSNTQPLYGIRRYFRGNNTSGPSQAPSSPTEYIDSIQYTTTAGNVTEVRFHSRKNVRIIYPNFPSDKGYYYDTIRATSTLATYTISYLNGNVSKIHSDDKTTGKVIDQEYTYGTGKGVVHDCQWKPLICPDQILVYQDPFGQSVVFNLGTNELLKIKNTFVTDNKIEETTFAYTFDQFGYPVSADITAPVTAISGFIGKSKATFEYLIK